MNMKNIITTIIAIFAFVIAVNAQESRKVENGFKITEPISFIKINNYTNCEGAICTISYNNNKVNVKAVMDGVNLIDVTYDSKTTATLVMNGENLGVVVSDETKYEPVMKAMLMETDFANGHGWVLYIFE